MNKASQPEEKLLETIEEQKQAIVKLAESASKRLLIFSYAFEPEYYDNAEFIAASKNLVLAHSQCHIKILVQNNENLRNHEHRYLALMQRLPSRIELKICHEDFRNHPETFMLADYDGLFLKRVPGRSTARYYLNAPRLNEEYSRLFQSIWEQSEHDITLRRLSL